MILQTPTPLTLTKNELRNADAKLAFALAQMRAESVPAGTSIEARRAHAHGMAVVLRELSMLSDPDFDAIVAECRVLAAYGGDL